MIRLKSDIETPKRNWRHRPFRFCLVIFAIGVAAIVSERWRGQWCLKRWLAAQVRNGENFEVKSLWPARTPQTRDFSNAFARATAKPLGSLSYYTADINGIIPDKFGQWKRGSQQIRPLRSISATASNTWQNLGELLAGCEPTLESLRVIMQHPAAAMDYDAEEALAHDTIPNYVGVRVSAQLLHAAIINNLHDGDLAAAEANLRALLAFARLYEKDPTLVSYMIRMAILGLTVDAFWDALQNKDWTEAQLSSLLKACPDTDHILSQMPKCQEAERIAHIYRLNKFRANSYESWLQRYEPLLASFGMPAPNEDTEPLLRFTRQWIFHPLWKFAWADEEELDYLRYIQGEIGVLRETTEKRSCSRLRDQLVAIRQTYPSPIASWRFYQGLPLVERIDSPSQKDESTAYPYCDFSRAWESSMKNLTLMNMVKTAIAIELHKYKHGTAPSRLTDLVPELLNALPVDLMDGEPLRYRKNPNGSFALYSVGDNAVDDGGLVQPASTNIVGPNILPWRGKDWVWQTNAPSPGSPELSGTLSQNHRH